MGRAAKRKFSRKKASIKRQAQMVSPKTKAKEQIAHKNMGGYYHVGFDPEQLHQETEQFLINLSCFAKNHEMSFSRFINAVFHENTKKDWINILSELTTNNNQILRLQLESKVLTVKLEQLNNTEMTAFIKSREDFIEKRWSNNQEWSEIGDRVNFIHFSNLDEKMSLSILISLSN